MHRRKKRPIGQRMTRLNEIDFSSIFNISRHVVLNYTLISVGLAQWKHKNGNTPRLWENMSQCSLANKMKRTKEKQKSKLSKRQTTPWYRNGFDRQTLGPMERVSHFNQIHSHSIRGDASERVDEPFINVIIHYHVTRSYFLKPKRYARLPCTHRRSHD